MNKSGILYRMGWLAITTGVSAYGAKVRTGHEAVLLIIKYAIVDNIVLYFLCIHSYFLLNLTHKKIPAELSSSA